MKGFVKILGTVVTMSCLVTGVVCIGVSATTETETTNNTQIVELSVNNLIQTASLEKQVEQVVKICQENLEQKKKAEEEEKAETEAKAKTTIEKKNVTVQKNAGGAAKVTQSESSTPQEEEEENVPPSLIEQAEIALQNSGGGASRIVALTNLERAQAGLGFVHLDGTLSAMAQERAQEIVECWSHTRPDGSNVTALASEYGLSYSVLGENLGKGYSSPDAVMNAWMNSPKHRDNILSGNKSRIGVGIYNCNGKTYWVQLFAN